MIAPSSSSSYAPRRTTDYLFPVVVIVILALFFAPTAWGLDQKGHSSVLELMSNTPSESPGIQRNELSISAPTLMIATLHNGSELEDAACELFPNEKSPWAAETNTEHLQRLIDDVADAGGGTITLPRGQYYFAGSQKNFDNESSFITHKDADNAVYFCVECRSNVTLIGSGEDLITGTILKPISRKAFPTDMFYYNDVVESNFKDNPPYLLNAHFTSFCIDGAEAQTTEVYNAKGKGFFINLFAGCSWNHVTVKNTDGTGFGMDCPIDSSISHCTAIGCGKAATVNSMGASGFGIGYGFSNRESMTIANCLAIGNRKFGFFFENQKRFNSHYAAPRARSFIVEECQARGNLFNFGGEMASGVAYIDCEGGDLLPEDPNPLESATSQTYYFGTDSKSNVVVQDGQPVAPEYFDRGRIADVQNHWVATEGWLDYVLEKGLMRGINIESGIWNFEPDKPITQAQLAIVLLRCAQNHASDKTVASLLSEEVADIETQNITEKDAMAWASEQGLLPSFSAETLTPDKYDQPVSRETLAVALHRFSCACEGSPSDYYYSENYFEAPDAAKVSPWAIHHIAWCYDYGLFEDSIRPLDSATRAETAKMITLLMRGLFEE